MNPLNVNRFFSIFVFFASFLSTLNGLQCFNCRGITNYDPNGCFNPSAATTYIQECAKNEVCEKRVTQVDRLQDVIDRGCSPNCVGGQFVWTDEFQVYCCNDKSVCNSAPKSLATDHLIEKCGTVDDSDGLIGCHKIGLPKGHD